MCARPWPPPPLQPLWFHWLFHAGENADNQATIWSIGCSHLYVGFKLVAMIDRIRTAAQACKSVLFVSLPMGKYASMEEVMELGENRECTICTDEHTAPVRARACACSCVAVAPAAELQLRLLL